MPLGLNVELEQVCGSYKELIMYTNNVNYMYPHQNAPGKTKAGKLTMDCGEAKKRCGEWEGVQVVELSRW